MITFGVPCINFSFILWKDAGQPNSPIGLMIHSNCPLPGIVKAVLWASFGCRGICQKPDVRSRVVKIVEFALTMSPIHSLISFMLYLSMWECSFSSLKSCTIFGPCPVFFGTQKIGELYIDCDLLTTPNLSLSVSNSSMKALCASGILYCFLYTGLSP